MAANAPQLPMSPEALAQFNAGNRCFAERNLPAALRHFQSALKLAGEHPGILEGLARVAEAGGDTASAVNILQHMQRCWPSPRVAEWLARLHYRRQQYRETVALLGPLLSGGVFKPELLSMFSFALEMTGDRERSREVIEDLHARAPDAGTAAEMVATWMRHADYAQLDACLPALLDRYPGSAEIAGTAAVWYLGSGNYPRGIECLRRRLELLRVVHPDARVAACPAWDGRPFAGTLLVSLEPMLGDEVLMTSLLRDLAAMGQSVVVEVDARCLDLYRRSFPSAEFVSRASQSLGEHVASDGSSRRAMTVELLQGLQRTWTLPGNAGWLRPSPSLAARKRAEYRARWPGKRLLGISWRSKQQYLGVESKSASLADFNLTLSTPGVVFVSLQYGDMQADIDALPAVLRPWRDPEIDAFNDIDGLAAQISALDQVVTVSCATAHLAGALGVPTTVMLPKRFPVLWPWGLLGEETTWYGSVRLLRNPQDSGWTELDRMLAADFAGPRRCAGPDSRLSPA